MIAMAKSVSYGCNTLRYITGETPNKEHPERVSFVYNNMMADGLDARGMWDSFKLTLARHGKTNGRLKNSVVSIMLSPPPDKVKWFGRVQWKQLGLDYFAIYDSLTLRDEKGDVFSEPTNILGSKFTMWLHEDSDSGVPHLHIAALRIDKDGKTNNDHQILQRAQQAAAQLAQKRGWMTAMEVREDHLADVEHNCQEILCKMTRFSYDAYFDALRELEEDYIVTTKRDSNGNYVSYVICDGNKRYPASHIGKSRKYTVAHLEETWKKVRAKEIARLQALQEADARRQAGKWNTQSTAQKPVDGAKPWQQQSATSAPKEQRSGTSVIPSAAATSSPRSSSTSSPLSPSASSKQNAVQPATSHPTARRAAPRDYSKWLSGTTGYNYTDDRNKTTRYYLPSKVMDFFDDEFDYKTVSNWPDLMHLAVGLFVEVVMGPAEQPTVSVGGGGPTSGLPWRDKDEDDMHWARRCAQYATRKLGKTKKYGRTR